MSDYQRQTHQCMTLAQMQPALAAALVKKAADVGITDLERETLMICETKSVKTKSGLFDRVLGDPDNEHYTAMAVTPVWLLWGTTGQERTTAILAARLRDVETYDYNNNLVPDTGIEVSGLFRGASETALAFIGLGSEPDAQEFKRVLYDAVRRANEPQKT